MIRRALALAVPVALAACGSAGPKSPVSSTPAAPLSERLDTAHITFRFAVGDSVEAQRQEAHHDWVTQRLEVSLPSRMQYFKYLNQDHMFALTGRSAQGLAEPERLEVHSIYRFHPHEAVHVYSALIGRPSDFFNEGLAVAFANDPLNGSFEGRYSNQPVHPWARQNQALLRPIEEMVTTDAFRRVPDAISYPQAGSFVEFLVEAEGCAAVRELFRRGRLEDTLDTIRAAFQASFGFSLAEAESRWRAFLTSGVAPALGAGPSTRCVAVRGSSWRGLGPRRPQTPGAD